MKQLILLSGVIVCLTACGGGGGGTPTQPSAPPPQPQPPANRAPSVSATASPAFGIHGLTTFTLVATASDPDADSLTFAWTVGDGSTASTATFTRVFTQGGSFTPSVTVSDGRGGSASASTSTVIVGSATGTWRGTGPTALGTFSLTLTQENSGRVTGTYFDSTFGAGQLDAASTINRIDAQGAIEMRVKQGPFTDWTFRGTMDQTGRRITGGVFGSGFTGQPFTLTKD